jgi:GT2 family glycosyltransferase
MKYSEKIGVVTVLYKSETVLDNFFSTLNQQSYDNFILYVIDNKSPDDSLSLSKQLAKTVFFETKFIENDDNYGVAKGNNQGIKAALADSCDYVLLSNNDVVLKPDTIEKLYSGLQETGADMTVPKIYFYGTNLIWAAGGKFRKLTSTTIHIGSHKEDKRQYDKCYSIDYAPTCFMLIKKDVFSIVGVMDEKYFVYSDDTDFVYRAIVKKQKLFYIYNSTIEHKESTSTSIRSDFYYYYLFRNRIYFAKKHQYFYILLYYINIFYHYSIRNLKFLYNRHQWKLILNAIHEGLKVNL